MMIFNMFLRKLLFEKDKKYEIFMDIVEDVEKPENLSKKKGAKLEIEPEI